MVLKSLFFRIDELYHTAQMDAFFAWLASKTFLEPFFVLIDLPHQEDTFDAHRKRIPKDKNICGFIVCQTNTLAAAFAKLPYVVPGKDWYRIWYAEGIEIWENKKIHGVALPLRFGLSLSEKTELLRFARGTMKSFFDNGHRVSQPDLSAHKAQENVTVDVCIWIDGKLRGSSVSAPLPFIDALHHASLGALRDPRMQPVEEDELEKAQIEISIMSDIVLPLREPDLERKIDAHGGYHIEAENKKKRYFPAAFNCTRFIDMRDLKKRLVKEKAQIIEEVNKVPLYSFQVESCIEDTRHGLMLLEGPAACSPIFSADSFEQRVRIGADRAGEWLASMCDMHGAMPLFVDPLCGRTGRMDWSRASISAYALAAYGEVTDNENFRNTARRAGDYLARYIFDVSGIPLQRGVWTSLYLSHMNLVLNRDIEPKLISSILDNYKILEYHPIRHATLASFFALLTLHTKGDYLSLSTSFAETVYNDFERNKSKNGTALAQYPELIYAYSLLYELTKNNLYSARAGTVAQWLIDQQQENGSFPSKTDLLSPYTRGTGKIFEVLALYPSRYHIPLEKSFDWLIHMQYTPDSLYFADRAFRDRAVGGFRHDYANTEAWIDAAGHFLLGAARLLGSDKSMLIKK